MSALNVVMLLASGAGWWSFAGLAWPLAVIGPILFMLAIVTVLSIPEYLLEWAGDACAWLWRRLRRKAL